MKKETFSNGTVVAEQPKDSFIKELEQTTSVVDFYSKKEKILSALKSLKEKD